MSALIWTLAGIAYLLVGCVVVAAGKALFDDEKEKQDSGMIICLFVVCWPFLLVGALGGFVSGLIYALVRVLSEIFTRWAGRARK